MKTLKKAISEFSEDRCMQMAAALAFYTMLSLAPLLVLVVTIASLVMGPQAKQTFTRQASNLVGPQGAEELEELLDRGQSQQGAGAEAQGSGQSQPSADQPSGDQPSADQPSADQPSADQPSADQPSADQPSADQPSGGANQEQSQGGGSGWSVPSIITNIASVLVLIFGATGIMAQLQMSLNQMWEIEPDPDQGGISGFLKKRLVSLAMILAIAFLLLVSMLLTTAVSAFGEWISSTLGVQRLGSYAISEGTTIIIVTILFAAMFKFLPDAEVPWKVTWVGALMTALLFTVGKFLIGLYLGSKDMSSAYGQAGSLVLVLLWVYYTAIIFFFGAELTQVWARRHGHAIQPAEGAMRVVVRKESVPAPGG